MALFPVILPDAPTFESSNPWLKAMSAVQGIRRNQLSNQMLAARAQYEPQTLQSQLDSNALRQRLTQAQIPVEEARLPLMQVQTKAQQESLKFLPERMRIASQNAATKQLLSHISQQRIPTSQVYALSRLIGTPAGQALIANNPQVTAGIANALIQASKRLSGVSGGATSIPSPQPSAPSTLPQPSVLPQPSTLPPSASGVGAGLDAQTIKRMQEATGSALEKRITPAPVLAQRTYALSVHNMLNQLSPDMPDIVKFAGLSGKANLKADELGASLGINKDPAYQKYMNFIHIQAPLISNELRRAFGGQATDSEQRIMGNLVNPTYWNSNPKIALNQFNQLFDSLKANEAALVKDPYQTKKSLIEELNKPIKKTERTKITLPSFSTKEQFKSWYSKLSDEDKSRVRLKLGGES